MKKKIKLQVSVFIVLALTNVPGFASIKAIVGGNIVNPDGIPTIENATILIKGNKIIEIGEVNKVNIPKDAETIDAKGRWIIPGLIDSHIHFFQSGGLYTRPDVIDLTKFVPYVEKELSDIRGQIQDTFTRYLRCGITSVVDVGGPFWNFDIRGFAQQTEMAPRVQVCGPLISTYQPEALTTDDPPIIKVNSIEEALDQVHKQVEMKTDFIKIWYIIRSGHTPDEYFDLVKAIVDESHRLGKRVIVHATQLETAKAAVKAGADILAHGVADVIVDDEFIQLLKDHDVIYSSTIIVNEGYMEVLSKQVELNEMELVMANPNIVSTLFDLHHLPEEVDPKKSNDWVERRKQRIAINQKNLKIIQDAGVAIAANTDAGNIGVLPGPSFFREFDLLIEAGLTPKQILTAATINNAKFMGMQKDLGSIEKGKLADLVILNSNPLEDILNTSDIHMVIKDGCFFKPEEIIKEDAVSIVQRQVNAYNARNTDVFISTFSPTIQIYQDHDSLICSGIDKVRIKYQSLFDNTPNLHVQIVQRMAIGDYVIDEEKIIGFDKEEKRAIATYKIKENLIQQVWFYK